MHLQLQSPKAELRSGSSRVIRKWPWAVAALSLLLGMGSPRAAVSSWWNPAGGGGASTNGNLRLWGAVGQPLATTMRAGSLQLNGGPWGRSPGEESTVGNAVVWSGAGGDGKWCNRNNWSTLATPAKGDDVYITQDGTYQVAVDCIVGSGIRHLTLGGGSGTQTLLCASALSMPILVGTNGIVAVNGGHLQGPVTNWGKIFLTYAGIYGLSSPWFENEPGALVDIQADALIGGGVINNAGTFRNSGGAANNHASIIGTQIAFTNTGLLDVQANRLDFNSLGTLTSRGTINIANDAVLALRGGTYRFDPENRFTGGGVCLLHDNSIVQGVLNGTSLFRVDYSVTFDAELQAGTMLWNYGPGSLSGALTIGTQGVFNVGSTFSLLGVITNWGRIIWPGGGGSSWAWAEGARLENQAGAVFDLQFDGRFYGGSGVNRNFNNAGTFLKSGGNRTAVFDRGYVFANTGLLDLRSGALRSHNLTSSGIFNLADGVTLELGGGTFVFDPGHSSTGTGSLWVRGEEGMATLNGSIKGTPKLTMSGPATFNSQLDTVLWWTNSSLYGTLTMGPHGTINLVNGTKSLYGMVTNGGRINWLGNGGNWTWYDGARLENQPAGVVDLQGDGTLYSGGGVLTFNNAGTLRKSGGVSKSAFPSGFSFLNLGVVEALSGTLSFAGSVNQIAGETRMAGGHLAATAGFNLQGGSLTGAGTLTGSLTNTGGTVTPGNPLGAIALTGNYFQGSGGTLRIEVGGRNNGQFDRLSVGGGAQLDGALMASLVNSFGPELNDRFQILSCATRKGTFNAVNFPTGVSSDYSDTGVFLTMAGPAPLKLSPAIIQGYLVLSFDTAIDQTYVVEVTESLVPAQWSVVVNLKGNGLTQTVSVPLAYPQLFFRVRLP